MIRKIGIGSVGLLSLVFIWSCGSTVSNNARPTNAAPSANTSAAGNASASAPTVRKAEIATTAEAIYKEYKADPKSMEKYKGKVVEISGKFSRNSGSEDALEVKFDTGEPALEVSCRINASAVQAAAKYQKGQAIKMTGIGDPNSIIGPLFKDCQVAP